MLSFNIWWLLYPSHLHHVMISLIKFPSFFKAFEKISSFAAEQGELTLVFFHLTRCFQFSSSSFAKQRMLSEKITDIITKKSSIKCPPFLRMTHWMNLRTTWSINSAGLYLGGKPLPYAACNGRRKVNRMRLYNKICYFNITQNKKHILWCLHSHWNGCSLFILLCTK